jgi:hypothetical protein
MGSREYSPGARIAVAPAMAVRACAPPARAGMSPHQRTHARTHGHTHAPARADAKAPARPHTPSCAAAAGPRRVAAQDRRYLCAVNPKLTPQNRTGSTPPSSARLRSAARRPAPAPHCHSARCSATAQSPRGCAPQVCAELDGAAPGACAHVWRMCVARGACLGRVSDAVAALLSPRQFILHCRYCAEWDSTTDMRVLRRADAVIPHGTASQAAVYLRAPDLLALLGHQWLGCGRWGWPRVVGGVHTHACTHGHRRAHTRTHMHARTDTCVCAHADVCAC